MPDRWRQRPRHKMYRMKEHKSAIRRKYRAARDEITAQQKQTMDNEICRRFISLATYRHADALLVYAPINSEIDITAVVRHALANKKTVAFPLCDGDKHTMTYHIVTDLSTLTTGTYGIPEPPADTPVFDHREFNTPVCMVPALVYDRQGYRIGYGGGYYDRYLSDYTGTRVGVIYSDAIVDSLPHGRYDTTVDFLITEKGVITTNAI